MAGKMIDRREFCRQAETFSLYFLKLFLSENSPNIIQSMLYSQDVCNEFFSDGVNEKWDISENCHVCAEIVASEAALVRVEGQLEGINTVYEAVRPKRLFHASLLCRRETGKFQVQHLHLSASPCGLSFEDTVQPVEVILNNSKLLNEKTLNLEALADNIYGGLQICRLDENFTHLYVSSGFEKLTGYSREELMQLGGCHVTLIYAPDLPVLRRQVPIHMKIGQTFSVEYRIVRKDGTLVWVLDKGVRLSDDDIGGRVQCILLDVTTNKKQEEALQLSEKRYEIALSSSDLTMFEYNIVTKDLIFFNGIGNMYMLPSIVPNGPETLIERGTIEPLSVPGYREMYRHIHAGEPRASCLITTKDAMGVLHDFELIMTTIYDLDGNPSRAIGVRKNVTQMIRLQKEREFGKTLVANRIFICEANITKNKITDLNREWTERHDLRILDYTVSEFTEWFCQTLVAPKYKGLLCQKLELEYLSYKFKQGEGLESFSYKSKNEQGLYVWHEGTVNVIRDERSGDLYSRFYEEYINERKTKEQKALEEKRLYESMTAKAVLTYEVNITRNIAMQGHEEWGKLYGIKQNSDYMQMIELFAQKVVYFEDREVFYRMFRRENVLKCFYNGQRQISCQYRKQGENEDYRWACCILHLYEDPETGDVRGFSYVEDIDKQKREELALKFNAEHDLMTKFYNKITTFEKVQGFLETDRAKRRLHAFLMIDIDHFKQINDNFGHAFGDKVLCELSDRLRSIFREEDILGRIGGDEFCVFMKNVPTTRLVGDKAQEICNKLKRSYEQDHVVCEISASVGISMYPSNGMDYESLYHQADEALYQAKKNGRNCYVMNLG